MSKAALLALAELVPTLDGPGRTIETWIENHLELARWERAGGFGDIDSHRLEPRRYLSSLEAAISLYPELPGTVPSCPRKATAAALRAIAAQMPEGD